METLLIYGITNATSENTLKRKYSSQDRKPDTELYAKGLPKTDFTWFSPGS